MAAALAIVFTAAIWWPLIIPVAVAILSGILILTGGGVAPTTPLVLSLLLLGLAMPAAAYVAGVWLDRFALGQVGGRSFRLMGLLLAYVLMFQSGALEDGLLTTVNLAQGVSIPRLLPLASAVVGKVIFCGSAVAIVFSLAHAIVELPTLWVGSRVDRLGVLPVAAMRPLGVAFLTGISLQLIAGFWSAELWPPYLVALGGH